LITSRLCSTTITVLPRSTSRLSTSSSLWMSSKCRPVVGSSSRYRVRPVFGRASSAASLTRCASPPDSVGAGLQDAADFRDVLEQLQRLADAHGQDVGDGAALVVDGERLGVVAATVA